MRRAAFVHATTSSVRESSLVSSSRLLEYAAGRTGVHSLHKRRLPVEEPQLERAVGQRAGARVVRVQGPAPTAAGATARPRWRRSSPPAVTGPVGTVRSSGVVSRAGRVDPDAVIGERPLLAPRVPRFTGFAGSRRPSEPRVWPLAHRLGGWVIHFPAVVCTSSPNTTRGYDWLRVFCTCSSASGNS